MPPVFVSTRTHFVYEKPVFRLPMKEPMTKLDNPVLMATIGGAQGL
ncbi:ribosome maturation factor RimM, partial [Rhizobium ruizarguesonis]